MGRMMLIIIVGSAIAFGLIGLAMDKLSVSGTRNFVEGYVIDVCKNIANSGISAATEQIKIKASWRTGFSNLPLSLGTANVNVIDTCISSNWFVGIRSVGSYMAKTYTAVAILHDSLMGYLPPTVKAAITSNADVTTSGNFNADGRDHTWDDALIPKMGTSAVYTHQDYTRQGDSQLGGTYDSTDYPIAKSYSPNVVVEFGPRIPATPDSVMGGPARGFPEGTLKSIAQSRYHGSQYVTDPSALTFPLSGVTYVEYDGIWNPTDLGNSTGVLIVHNSSGTSVMKNIHGVFKGFVIADRIDHVNGDFLLVGAVVGMSEVAVGNVFGNGTGSVDFSREALRRSTGTTGINAGTRTMLTVVSYYE